MNIGQVSDFSGLPAKTIRYYEEIGLIAPMRGENGYRAFRDTDLHKLTFLARARSLGFTIDDCRSLMALYEDQSRASADVKKLVTQHLQNIDQKLEELTQMRQTLSHLVDACAGDDRPECPILKDLSKKTIG
ncbi:Cu(I)-responsive transcriptional regulator [Cochlodiniinecator piscidefendens]|uniref:Cu(I)-responsive transcriptional regulator n=1 Tax=Cochlodiniinecator piscidefendens TaxID=2715756 RepID=UPI001408C549|nr:Cu(I)-responsive transcriptional regulator [Cochlodiniinecator piscidefendens]